MASVGNDATAHVEFIKVQSHLRKTYSTFLLLNLSGVCVFRCAFIFPSPSVSTPQNISRPLDNNINKDNRLIEVYSKPYSSLLLKGAFFFESSTLKCPLLHLCLAFQ